MKQYRKSLGVAVAVIALALFAAGPSAAQRVTDLGLNLGSNGSMVRAINNSGMAVGAVMAGPSSSRAAVWLPGQVTATLLPLLDGYTEAVAFYVNDRGLVAGYGVNIVDQTMQACVWSVVKGRWTVKGLGYLPGTTHDLSAPTGINAAGQVVGASWEGEGMEAGFIWDAVNGMRPFAALSDGPNGASATIKPAAGRGIADNGLVAGTALTANGSDNGAIVWDSKTGEVFHEQDGEALAISPSGNMVAGYMPSSAAEWMNRNLVLWTWDDEQGEFVRSDLGHPAFSVDPAMGELWGWILRPLEVTDDGKIVGEGNVYYDIDGDGNWETNPTLNWFYSNGVFTDLASVLPAGTSNDIQEISLNAGGLVAMNVLGPGATVYFWDGEGTAIALPDLGGGYSRAWDINDDGVAVGMSYLTSSDPLPHAALWSTPGLSALKMSTPTFTVKGKTLTVTVKISASNQNNLAATDIAVTTATLNDAPTTTALPLSIGTLKVGASKAITLTFDNFTSGQEVELKLEGTCSLGNFFASKTVTLR